MSATLKKISVEIRCPHVESTRPFPIGGKSRKRFAAPTLVKTAKKKLLLLLLNAHQERQNGRLFKNISVEILKLERQVFNRELPPL
jgi:hypothetical protein